MNCEVNDDFFDDFYDDLNKCCIKPASGGISYLIKKSFQHNNPNSQCERSMDCAADNDNFYDEYYDDVDNFSNPFEGKENSLFNKNGKDLLSLKRTDPIFIPFNSKHRGVQEILKDVHVQPKRINEIIDVFNNLMKEEMSKKPKVVLLTGPPGCGKTFLMEKIFKLFEFRVKRYDEKQTLLNPNDSSLGKINYSGLFINFLYSCNYMAHRCYTSYGAKKTNLVFIDELPNFIYDDPSIFSKKIVEIIKLNCNPIYVFQFSKANTSSNHGHFWVFTPDVINDLEVKQIQMLPVANTLVFAALKKYVDQNQITMPFHGRELKLRGQKGYSKLWERILILANGDIRQGKIIIDFCTTENYESPEYKRRKSDIIYRHNAFGNHQRTFQPGFLAIFENGINFKVDQFHALGKLFYAKRLDKHSNPKILNEYTKTENMLIRGLENLKRPSPPEVSITDIVTYKPFTTSRIIEYLFEHEHYFANDIKSLNKIYDNVLTLDYALATDNLRYTELDVYMYEITCRSLLYYNYKEKNKSSTSNSFYSITKPLTGYKSLNEINNKIKKLHEQVINETNDIVCYRDLSDYLDFKDFVAK